LSSKCHCKTPDGFVHKHCEFQDASYAFVSPKTKNIFKTKISEYRMFHLGKVSHHASQIVFGKSLRFETGATLRIEEARSSFHLVVAGRNISSTPEMHLTLLGTDMVIPGVPVLKQRCIITKSKTFQG